MELKSKFRTKTDIKILGNTIRIGLMIVVCYVFSIQMITNILLQVHGVSISWVAFYWMIDILFVFFGTILFIKWNHPVANYLGPIYLFCIGYYMTRYLVEELCYMMPVVYVIHILFVGLLVLNLFAFIKHGLNNLHNNRSPKDLPKNRLSFRSKLLAIVGLFFLVWTPFTAWSYFGFSNHITISDPTNNNDFKIDFYRLPFGSFDIDYYLTPEADLELSFYSNWNTTFIFDVWNQTLLNSVFMDLVADVIRKFSEYNIKVVFDVCPANYIAAGSGPNSDYTTYYYTKEINETIDLVINYIKTEELSNFRGISMDVEGPIYKYDNFGNRQVVSLEKWAAAVTSFQNKLDEFKSSCPGNETFLIAMDGTLFDHYDDDFDLDVMQKTCSNPPQWDYFGYMTYNIGDPSGHYPFYYYMQQGYQRYGKDFMPWIGWINTYDQLEKNPYHYQMMLEELKIVKSMGIKEVVIAPSRNLFGNYSDLTNRPQILNTMFQRLHDINATRNDTFPTFNFPIYHDSRLYENISLYIKKWTPYTFMSNLNVFLDLVNEMNLGWLMFFELSFLGALVLILKEIGKRRENLN